MRNLKTLTLLHSNDMHGDFMAKQVDDSLLGGVSMLSGYVGKVRREEKNVIYAISGDMFRGSLIDSEYKGISTIEIMNMLAPDVVTLGNHEVDYGIAHLLFLEKCANFPIINANMYLTTNYARLFDSHTIIQMDGMRILFIGVLTEEVLAQTRRERLIGSIIDIRDAAAEIGKICDSYKGEDIDFTVVLTHIGIESDKELAAALDPRWGVDVIIGGHSHTLLEEPVVVAGIPIVQAASGTAYVGRFDIVIDTDTNSIDSFKWRLIPVNPENCPRDTQLEKIITMYKERTDNKYSRFITRLADSYTHPARNQETELGRLFADAFKDILGTDIVLIGSGSIRAKELGPIVLFRDLIETFPYNDEMYRIYVTGAQLRKIMLYILREEALGGRGEFYQLSHGLRIEYDRAAGRLVSLTLNGAEVGDDDHLRLALPAFHMQNIEPFLGVTEDEVSERGRPKVICTHCTDALEEYFSRQEFFKVSEENRLIIT